MCDQRRWDSMARGTTALTVAKMLAEFARLGAERAGAHEGVECCDYTAFVVLTEPIV